jgi:hypothetical protein
MKRSTLTVMCKTFLYAIHIVAFVIVSVAQPSRQQILSVDEALELTKTWKSRIRIGIV